MDRRLGRPLPHQLPNPTRADPKAINLSPEGHIRYYSQFPGAIPYLGARSHALLTRPPLTPKGALDLHVLGLPPAFVLSQDQTLKLKPPKGFLTSNLAHLSPGQSQVIIRSSFHSREPTNSEADTWIIGLAPYQADTQASRSKNDQTARISLQISSNVKKHQEQKSRIKRHSHDAPSGHPFPELSPEHPAHPPPFRPIQRSRLR